MKQFFASARKRPQRRNALTPAALGEMIPFFEPMKLGSGSPDADQEVGDCQEKRLSDCTASSSCSESSTHHYSQSRKEKEDPVRRISFDESVEVVPIPRRKEYSLKARRRMWISPDEAYSNIQRNKAEWDWEGKNWLGAVEDDQMVRCPRTGERVHPTWFWDEDAFM